MYKGVFLIFFFSPNFVLHLVSIWSWPLFHFIGFCDTIHIHFPFIALHTFLSPTPSVLLQAHLPIAYPGRTYGREREDDLGWILEKSVFKVYIRERDKSVIFNDVDILLFIYVMYCVCLCVWIICCCSASIWWMSTVCQQLWWSFGDTKLSRPQLLTGRLPCHEWCSNSSYGWTCALSDPCLCYRWLFYLLSKFGPRYLEIGFDFCTFILWRQMCNLVRILH